MQFCFYCQTSSISFEYDFKRSMDRRDRMVVGFITTYVAMPITTNVVSSNPAPARCTRYNII